MARSSFLLRCQLGLALGRYLAHEDVAGADLCADADDAFLVQVVERVLAHAGDVPRYLAGAEFRVARLHLVPFDVDGRELGIAHEVLGDDDGVLEVVALHRHERAEHVLAEREVAFLRGRAVGERGALGHGVSDRDDGALREAGALVGADELPQHVGELLAVLVRDDDHFARHGGDGSGGLGEHHLPGVARDALLHARADERGVRLDERDGLPLHVGAHQRPVGVVVLQERDERGGDAYDLYRRDVHVVHALGRLHQVVRGHPAFDAVFEQLELVVHGGVSLRDDELVLFVGGQVDDLIRVSGDVRVHRDHAFGEPQRAS